MTEMHGKIEGVTPGKDRAVRNGMPEVKPYKYQGDGNDARPFRRPACPECGGRPRLMQGSIVRSICQGCRVQLVRVWKNGQWSGWKKP